MAVNKKKLATSVKEQLAQKPGEFEWDRQGELDEKTNAWINRDKFEYDMGADPMYQKYKEQYTALGKLAMEDTVGQVSSLTGGYANSYAQTAGQQSYQNYMDQLNNMMPELYSMARSNYDAEGQQLYNEIALLEGQRSQAYNEYQADVNDWYNYLNFLQNEEASRRSSGGGGGSGGSNGVPDIIWERMEQGFENDEEKMAYLVTMAQQGYITSDQIAPIASSYKYDGYSDPTAADSETSTSNTNDFVKAIFMRKDEDGNYVFDIGGKEKTFAPGFNPYTGTKNSDVSNGHFSNGYQPDNVGGKKLSKTGDFVYVNGVRQNVWKTEDGTKYVWNGEENRYMKDSEIEYE